MRIVFMGTPGFSVPSLQKILAAKYDLVGVFTQPDRAVGRGLKLKFSPVKEVVTQYPQIKIFQPEKLSKPEEFQKLKELKPDLIVVVAFGQILKQEVLDLPKYGCINVHSSLLPRWRGAAPIQAAVLNGDLKTGVSIMKLVAKLDAGDVYLQKETEISTVDTAGSVHDRLADMGAELLIEAIEGIIKGSLKMWVQDESQMTYAPKLTKEMEKLDFTKPASVLDCQFRALQPWPGTSVMIDGHRSQLKSVRLQRDVNGKPAQLFEKSGMILIGTAHGSLEVLRLQPEGKKEMSVGDFINGLRGHGKSLPLDIS